MTDPLPFGTRRTKRPLETAIKLAEARLMTKQENLIFLSRILNLKHGQSQTTPKPGASGALSQPVA
ncbi:hypothetical protein [Aquitalea sp.]|uniref:hypothetical protein n=1 Tax=Aquitalea sp. TaxID=1872623 RepID=UPI00258ADB22|nr:hypothetical protein [Aquitalea sp.]